MSGESETFLPDIGFFFSRFCSFSPSTHCLLNPRELPGPWERKTLLFFSPQPPSPNHHHAPSRTPGHTQTLVCLPSLASISLPKYLPPSSCQRANISASTRTAELARHDTTCLTFSAAADPPLPLLLSGDALFLSQPPDSGRLSLGCRLSTGGMCFLCFGSRRLVAK